MFAKRIKRLTSSLVRDILSASNRPGMISFAGGLPAEETLYHPKDVQLETLNCWQYGPTEGEPELRELIAAHAQKMGINCTASQVLVLSGSQQGIDLVAKLFIEEDTPVLVEAPAYLSALQVFNLFGAKLQPVTVHSESGPKLDEFADTLAKSSFGYLTPTFQNPSGYCYTPEQRIEIAKIADKCNVPLFEDDPYRELSFEQTAPQPLVSHIKNAPWIYQGSFSKTLSPGLRLGYLIASPELFGPLVRLKQGADLHSNRLSQKLVAKMMLNGLEEHIASVLPIYRERRDAMSQSLDRHFSGLATWQIPQGGLFFWLTLNKKIDTNELMRQALDVGVAVMPGYAFYHGEETQSHLRLNFSHSTPEDIDIGLAKLAALLK